MSNTNDMQSGPGAKNKLEPHPDFDELLKAEKSRTTSPASPVPPSTPNAGAPALDDFNLDHELDGLDELDDLDGLDGLDGLDNLDEHENYAASEGKDGFHDFSDEDNNERAHEHEKGKGEDEFVEKAKKSLADHSDLSELEIGLGESGEESSGSNLDDSMEFNFDDVSTNHAETAESASMGVKKDPVKKSGSSMLYIIIAVVVVLVGGFFYVMSHKESSAKNQNTQQGTGFKPVLPEVHPLPQTLPPAVPQSLQPAETTVMGGSNEQVLTGSGQSYQSSAGSVTMLQINRQEMLELLANFQKSVDKSVQSMTQEVASLKSSLGAINASDVQLSQSIDGRLQQVNSQIALINQKFDTYNHSMSGVQAALEQTQQQLKLILAQRAEDIDHYTLRAIVSGRAWLVDGEGKTLTVTMGQEIKNYGSVQEINDKMGYVTMTSGFVFK